MSNLQGVTLPHTSQQLQANRNLQNGRSNNIPSTSLTQGNPTVLDEFKHGFPSFGLSTVSNKWWGSNSPNSDEKTFEDMPEANEGNHQTEDFARNGASSLVVDNTSHEDVPKESNIGLQGSGLLSSVRRKAAEEGREMLKLGVYRTYGSKKLGRREKMLLLRIFDSPLPSDWSTS